MVPEWKRRGPECSDRILPTLCTLRQAWLDFRHARLQSVAHFSRGAYRGETGAGRETRPREAYFNRLVQIRS